MEAVPKPQQFVDHPLTGHYVRTRNELYHFCDDIAFFEISYGLDFEELYNARDIGAEKTVKRRG
jgi:hypothetical protein